jgi:hypothetical protein
MVGGGRLIRLPYYFITVRSEATSLSSSPFDQNYLYDWNSVREKARQQHLGTRIQASLLAGIDEEYLF